MLPQNFHSKNKLIVISESAHVTEQAFACPVGASWHVCLLSQVNALSGLSGSR